MTGALKTPHTPAQMEGPSTRLLLQPSMSYYLSDMAKPESSSKPEDRVRVADRLLFILDNSLRTLMRRRVELNLYLLEALDSAGFQKVPLVDIHREIKAPELNLSMPIEPHKKIRVAAEKRDASLNIMAKSA